MEAEELVLPLRHRNGQGRPLWRYAILGCQIVAICGTLSVALYVGWHVLLPKPQPFGFSRLRAWGRFDTLATRTNHFRAVAALDLRLRAKHGQNALRCSDEYGIGMLTAWQSAKVSLCSPRNDRQRSDVTCYIRHEFANSRYACVLTGARLRSADPPDFHAKYDVQCTTAMRDKWLSAKQFANVDNDARHLPLSISQLHGVNDGILCDPKKMVNHTVIWVPRWDGTNTYHSFEDLISTYETLMVTGDDPKDVEIAWYDLRTDIPLSRMVYGALLPKLFHGARVVRHQPFSNGTCFRRAILGVHGGQSQLSRNRGTRYKSTCQTTSPILRTFVDWLRNGTGLPPRNSPTLPCASHYRSVIFISRRPPYSRVLPNEAELVESIRKSLPNGWKIRAVQFEKVGSIMDQIRLVSETSVLVGTHGAGHMLSVFLPRGAASVEMFYSNKDYANQHYVNVDHLMGDTYHDALSPVYLGYNGPIAPEKVLPEIMAAVKHASSC